MAINIIKVFQFVVCLVFLLVSFQQDSMVVNGRLMPIISSAGPRKPDPNDAVATARWLVSQNFWGVLKNVVSFSDGLPNQGSGIPYFYLTPLDPTAKNALKDQRASFTASEYPLGTCGKIDPENPTCSKITLTGKLKLVDEKSKEAEYARNALFSKHTEMKGWPKDHNFQVF